MLLGKLAEKQQIGTFLKAEVAVLGKSGNQIFDIVTTIEELAVCGNRFTIDNFCGNVRWTTLKSEQETIYVQATGSCFYNGVEQDITIQFETAGIASNDSVKEGDPFRVSWIGFGEEKRTYDEMTEFLYAMFESYANDKGLDLEEYQKDGILMNQAYYNSQDQDDVDTNSDSSDDYDDGIDSNGFYEE